jgi:hypothetical protein
MKGGETMKAVGALLREQLGIKTAKTRAPSEGKSASDQGLADVEPFQDAFKAAVGKFREEEKSGAETPVARKFPDENSTPADVGFLQRPDKNEPSVKLGLTDSEIGRTVSVETPRPNVEPLVDDIVATEDIPLQTGDQTPQSTDRMSGALEGFEARGAMSLLDSGVLVARENEPFATADPLAEDTWVMADEPAQDAPTYAAATGDSGVTSDSVPTLAEAQPEAQPEEFDLVLDTALSTQVEPSKKEDAALLGSRFLQWSRAEDPTNSAKVTPPIVPFDSVFQQISPEQLHQPEATHSALRAEPLFDQIVQSVRFAQYAETSELQIHLKPDFLGRLSIRVLSDHHGMHLEIKAENEMVRQVMQDNLTDLQQRLADKGFAFNQFSLLADTGWTARREPGRTFAPPSDGVQAAPQATAEMLLEPASLLKSGAIDYFA